MSGTGIGPMTPNYRRVKIVRNFTKDATTAKCSTSTVEMTPIKCVDTYVEPIRCDVTDVEPIKCIDTDTERIRCDVTDVEPIKCIDTNIEPIKCDVTDVDPINCDVTVDVERIKNAVPQQLTSCPMTKESVVASPVDKVNSESTSTDAAQSASTSDLIDELFKEFLAVKMESIEAEYQAVQEAQKQQQILKTENTCAIDSPDAIKGECSNDVVASPRRKRHHSSKDRTHKSKHKDRSRHKSGKHKKERRRHGSHAEENRNDKNSSLACPTDRTDIVAKTENKFSSTDSPKEDLRTDVDIRNGLDTVKLEAINDSVVNSSTSQKARLPVDVNKMKTEIPTCASSQSDRESVVEGVSDKHDVPIVRVFGVKATKTDKPGEDAPETVSVKSKQATQEASSKPEKDDPLWDIALSAKANDGKSADEIPQGVFDTTHVKGKQHIGFTFGLKISAKSADRISRRNREEGG